MVRHHEKFFHINLRLNRKPTSHKHAKCDSVKVTVISSFTKLMQRHYTPHCFINERAFRVAMNRLFGRGTPKAPAPNLSDCVANVDSRAESVDKKIARLDAELRKYKVYIPGVKAMSLTVRPPGPDEQDEGGAGKELGEAEGLEGAEAEEAI